MSYGVTYYYSLPFNPGGITLRLDVSYGYISGYVSVGVRNPGPGNYYRRIDTSSYADEFIYQAGISGTRYVYIGLRGNSHYNSRFLLNSTIGDFSSQGKKVNTI